MPTEFAVPSMLNRFNQLMNKMNAFGGVGSAARGENRYTIADALFLSKLMTLLLASSNDREYWPSLQASGTSYSLWEDQSDKKRLRNLILFQVVNRLTVGKWNVHPASMAIWIEGENRYSVAHYDVNAESENIKSKANTMLKEHGLPNNYDGLCRIVTAWANTDAGLSEMTYIAKLIFNLLSTKEGK